MKDIHISIHFDQDLRPLLHPSHRGDGRVDRHVHPGTTIKDLVESLHVPHPEVGQLLVDGREVGFACQVEDGDRIEVRSLVPPVDPCTPSLLRPKPLAALKFMVDVNVAKLGTFLRMAGIDASCRPELCDRDIAAAVEGEGRVLLSRDRGLLKRRIVSHGHLVCSQQPEEQLAEVVHLYGLSPLLRPFTRCMDCNRLLVEVEKGVILDRLEPLTRKYYQSFSHCPSCDKIYWSGSHKKKMIRLLAGLGLKGC